MQSLLKRPLRFPCFVLRSTSKEPVDWAVRLSEDETSVKPNLWPILVTLTRASKEVLQLSLRFLSVSLIFDELFLDILNSSISRQLAKRQVSGFRPRSLQLYPES